MQQGIVACSASELLRRAELVSVLHTAHLKRNAAHLNYQPFWQL
jgi:hypothetical protein